MPLPRWMARLRPGARTNQPAIPDALWQQTLARYPFLLRQGAQSADALKDLAQQFLAQKEFHGAAGLALTDEMADATRRFGILKEPIYRLPTAMPSTGVGRCRR